MTTLPLNEIARGNREAIASNQIRQDIIEVNDTMALAWLELNKRNRPISAIVVERYRLDMLNGRWDFTGDPIRFDTNGHLIDGQHRLTALSRCPGLTLPLAVLRGLPTESQMAMDQGRKRQAGQQLAIKGIRNAHNIAAGARVYLLWESDYLFRDNKATQIIITTPLIEEWVDQNRDLVEQVSNYFNAIKTNDAPPSVALAAALKFHQIDDEKSREFFMSLANGGRPVGHPINTLDKRLQRIRREGLKMNQRDYLSLFIMAWNAFRDNKTMTKFQRPRGGKWNATNFPTPK